MTRDFDRGRPGAPVQGEPDGLDHTTSGDVYDPRGYAGTQGARGDLRGDRPPCRGSGDSWGGALILPQRGVEGDEIWFRVRVNFPRGWSWISNGVGMKFLRFTRYHSDDSNAGRYDLYFDEDHDPADPDTRPGERQPYLMNEFGVPDPRWYLGNGTSDDPQLGEWETWEMYLFLDDVPADAGGAARARVWKNGRLLAERTDTPTLNVRSDYVESVLISTYWNGVCEAPDRDQSVRYDDLEVRTRRPGARDARGNWMIGP